MKCPCCKYVADYDDFKLVQIVTYLYISFELQDLDREYQYLHICPKCGVTFKEVI